MLEKDRKIICQKCHSPMRRIDDITFRCTKCNIAVNRIVADISDRI